MPVTEVVVLVSVPLSLHHRSASVPNDWGKAGKSNLFCANEYYIDTGTTELRITNQ